MGSGATRFRTRSSAGATRFENEENIHCCLFHSRKYLLLQFYLGNTVVRTREPYIAFCFTRVSHDVICIQIAEIVICKHIRPFSNDMICIKIVKIVNMNRHEFRKADFTWRQSVLQIEDLNNNNNSQNQQIRHVRSISRDLRKVRTVWYFLYCQHFWTKEDNKRRWKWMHQQETTIIISLIDWRAG